MMNHAKAELKSSLLEFQKRNAKYTKIWQEIFQSLKRRQYIQQQEALKEALKITEMQKRKTFFHNHQKKSFGNSYGKYFIMINKSNNGNVSDIST